MRRLERDKDRGHKGCDADDGGDKKLARHRIDLAPDAAGQLAEPVFRRQGDRLQVPTGLGRGVAAGMALKQLCSQPFFQRVDMADHGCMVYAQRFGGTRNRAKAGHMKGRADFIPVVEPHARPRACWRQRPCAPASKLSAIAPTASATRRTGALHRLCRYRGVGRAGRIESGHGARALFRRDPAPDRPA